MVNGAIRRDERDHMLHEAKAYGIELAAGTRGELLEMLASIGYKGVTGYEYDAELDSACRFSAQDEAKRLIAVGS